MPSSSPLRTLVVMHVADVSGPSRSLADALRWLATDGDVEVLVPGDGNLRDELGEFARVTPLRYEPLMVPRGPAWPAMIRRVARETRDFRAAVGRSSPDLVIVTSALLPAALRAARAECVKTLLYAGEILDEPRVVSRRRALAGGLLLRHAARSATAVIACSDRVARQYRGRAKRLTTIEPPIGDRYEHGDAGRFRSEHGLPEGVPLIVAAGALSHGRGQDVLIRALAGIRGVHPEVRLAIAGDPHPRAVDREYAAELRRLAEELTPGAVTFTGFLERIEDAYSAATVVVNPTRYESFGRVAFEAMRARRPVVSTSAGAIPELLRDGEDSLLVPPDDAVALGAALARLLGDPGLADRLTRAGAARVRDELHPAAALARFREVVAGLGYPAAPDTRPCSSQIV